MDQYIRIGIVILVLELTIIYSHGTECNGSQLSRDCEKLLEKVLIPRSVHGMGKNKTGYMQLCSDMIMLVECLTKFTEKCQDKESKNSFQHILAEIKSNVEEFCGGDRPENCNSFQVTKCIHSLDTLDYNPTNVVLNYLNQSKVELFCRELNTAKDCFENYVSECAGEHMNMVKALKYLDNGLEKLCKRVNFPQNDENVKCIMSNVQAYAPCHEKNELFEKLIGTNGSTDQICTSYMKMIQCAYKVSNNVCGKKSEKLVKDIIQPLTKSFNTFCESHLELTEKADSASSKSNLQSRLYTNLYFLISVMHLFTLYLIKF